MSSSQGMWVCRFGDLLSKVSCGNIARGVCKPLIFGGEGELRVVLWEVVAISEVQ
jgi:hypothetical protein